MPLTLHSRCKHPAATRSRFVRAAAPGVGLVLLALCAGLVPAPQDRFEPDGLGGRVKINPGSKTLAGTGLGLRYRFRRFLRAELYWGANLTSDADVPSSGQSHGVHFRIRAEIP